MAVTLHKYLSTRDIVIDGRTAWAHDTKTWPTLMLLVVAALSAAVNLAVLFAYMRDVAAANKTETLSTIVVWGGHITVWGTTAALYRYGKDTNGVSNDLWGWTCSQSAATIQAPFNNVVHFPTFCHVQVSVSLPSRHGCTDPPVWCATIKLTGVSICFICSRARGIFPSYKP